MTPKQAKLLDFIRDRLEATGVAPSYTEMSVYMGNTRSNCHLMVDRLAREGKLKRVGNADRNLRLASPWRSLNDVPTGALRAELARREAAL